MSATTHKGLVIPTAGDDLLAAWRRLSDSAGVIVPADSVAAARVKLSQMEAAGAAPTPAHPLYLDIGGIVYRSDGRKNGQVWVLSPLNEIEADDQTYGSSWSARLAAGEASGMITSKLPTRPYDRRVLIDGNIYGSATGAVDMVIVAHGREKLSRIASGEAHSVSGTLQVVIPAGVQPSIALGVRGGSGGGSVSLAYDNRFNTLSVTAYPITMSR